MSENTVQYSRTNLTEDGIEDEAYR